MKINFTGNMKKTGLALVLAGTIATCVVVSPKILGSYFNEDVKTNRQNIMMMLAKSKKEKGKVMKKYNQNTIKKI